MAGNYIRTPEQRAQLSASLRALPPRPAKRYRRVSTPQGLAQLHRLRAEVALGKPLPPGAVVHHADGTKSEQSPLVICQDENYHRLLHARMRVKAAGGNPNTDRICSRCRAVKPLTDFRRHRNRLYGRDFTCRCCARIDDARYASPRRPS